jgi:GNAT superfamily N-acetyltransferase
MGASIRRANRSDANEVGRVHYRSHVETYSGTFPDGVIQAFPAEQRAQMWERMIAGDSGALWVAEVDEQVVGFAATGPSRDDPPVRALELGSIYLLAAHHGSGLGQALLDAALGAQNASLWVLDDNPRARSFYTRNGFTPDGAEKVDEQFGNVREIRMVR